MGHTRAFLVNTLDPDVVVVGGALGLSADYLSRIDTTMRATIAHELSNVPLLPAELNESAGVIGAALVLCP